MKQFIFTLATLSAIPFTNGSDLLGSNLTKDWFAPVAHAHESANGAPFIHPLTLETAFTGRKLFLDYGYSTGTEEREIEYEIELELALTRRLGILLELPFLNLEESGESSEEGFGNIGVAGRALLLEHENFLLSFNLEFGLPTGEGEVSDNEYSVEPSLLAWINLGNNWSLQTALGYEYAFQSDESELFFDAALIYNIGTAFTPQDSLSATFEISNEIGLSNDESGDTTTSGVAGLIYNWNENFTFRGGYTFPLSNRREFSKGFTLGIIHEF